MRFWKGPGYPWPTIKVDIFNEKEREIGHRCSPQDRGEHSFIQQGIRTALIEAYERDPILFQWVNSLFELRYNFQTDETKISKNYINNLLDRLTLGEVCQGFAGDVVIQTAYYFITRMFNLNEPLMFNLNEPGMFDIFISEMLPHVLDIERQVVNYQLLKIKNPDINEDVQRRVRVLKERQEALNQPIPEQPIFEPAFVYPNPHI